MSKGNLFLGFGRGKVGDVVFFRQYGEQITRARNRAPKNPQTALQLLQRVVLKTVSSAYSLLQPLANHSFQGEQEGTPNQSMFTKRNVEIFRTRLASIINDGDPSDILSSTEANFSRKASSGAEINSYLISEGSIASMEVSFINGVASLLLGDFSTAPTYSNLTYQQVVDALGLRRGDQLTFVWLGSDDSGDEGDSTFRAFDYARVILEPANGDMSTLFSTNTGAINSPNVRNEGTVVLGISGTGTYFMTFSSGVIPGAAGRKNSLCAATVIASRLNGSVWERSTQQLILRPAGTSEQGALNFDNNLDLLGDSVLSFMSEASSSLYLNQSKSFKSAGATAGKIWLESLPLFDPTTLSQEFVLIDGTIIEGTKSFQYLVVEVSPFEDSYKINILAPATGMTVCYNPENGNFYYVEYSSVYNLMDAVISQAGFTGASRGDLSWSGKIYQNRISSRQPVSQ